VAGVQAVTTKIIISAKKNFISMPRVPIFILYEKGKEICFHCLNQKIMMR
jgi:hypothetical protein